MTALAHVVPFSTPPTCSTAMQVAGAPNTAMVGPGMEEAVLTGALGDVYPVLRQGFPHYVLMPQPPVSPLQQWIKDEKDNGGPLSEGCTVKITNLTAEATKIYNGLVGDITKVGESRQDNGLTDLAYDVRCPLYQSVAGKSSGIEFSELAMKSARKNREIMAPFYGMTLAQVQSDEENAVLPPFVMVNTLSSEKLEPQSGGVPIPAGSLKPIVRPALWGPPLFPVPTGAKYLVGQPVVPFDAAEAARLASPMGQSTAAPAASATRPAEVGSQSSGVYGGPSPQAGPCAGPAGPCVGPAPPTAPYDAPAPYGGPSLPTGPCAGMGPCQFPQSPSAFPPGPGGPPMQGPYMGPCGPMMGPGGCGCGGLPPPGGFPPGPCGPPMQAPGMFATQGPCASMVGPGGCAPFFDQGLRPPSAPLVPGALPGACPAGMGPGMGPCGPQPGTFYR